MAYLGTPIDTTNQFQSLQGKRFDGDGSTTAFTLDIAPSSVFDIEVFVENVRQDPNSAYGISGTTLTFTGAPPSGTNNIYVVHQAKAVGTIDVPASGVVPASLASNIISGQTELAATPADTDEFLISDAGTIKRIDYSYIKAANTPAFEAYLSADQSISDNSSTKVQFDTERFDSNSDYDNSSNYRFTPTVAGKYYVYSQVEFAINDYDIYVAELVLKRNGSNYISTMSVSGDGASLRTHVAVKGIIEFNGSSDYVEIFGKLERHGSSGNRFDSNTAATYFGAFKVIGA